MLSTLFCDELPGARILKDFWSLHLMGRLSMNPLLSPGFDFATCEFHVAAAPVRILSKIFTSKGSCSNSPTVWFKRLK